ncbi:hypothetical protein SLEP1_g13837 [Rubroshorea leprosula]|uniref:UDP-glycosyltransferases domain-containing protein n=1 Tax=Rubroshorea leprosula TaxID=152421 RepID=A0AAV5IR92_9ROSI|nr:hypothetical protein SLEP1_g13837 [Rubroshorea leprosula]
MKEELSFNTKEECWSCGVQAAKVAANEKESCTKWKQMKKEELHKLQQNEKMGELHQSTVAAKCRKLSCTEVAELPRDQACCRAAKGPSMLQSCQRTQQFQELEPETIKALQDNVPFYAIGPIFPSGFTKSIVATNLWSESDCTQWLDAKPHGSVLYVSFGSYAHVTKRDLVEMANGILLSKVNFLWVIRPDVVSSDDVDPLPAGFKEEVSDRGMIITWCCQTTVLSHPAIGGFLTHCGWNSILESTWCQVPLLCYPLLTDQFTNRKLVVDDWKIGVNLSNTKIITQKEVLDNIDHLMGENLGNEFRIRIKEVKKILENALTSTGSSENNLERFIKKLEEKLKAKKIKEKKLLHPSNFGF